METKRTHSPLAVLSSTKPVNEIGFAALSLESSSDGWYQLLPAGHFKAVDGRPFDVASGQWFLDEPTALSLIADLKSRVNPTVIDYEHQTLLTDQNGQPAPASGWIKDAQWRDSVYGLKPTGQLRHLNLSKVANIAIYLPCSPTTNRRANPCLCTLPHWSTVQVSTG